MNQNRIPGVSACVVRDSVIEWAGSYGYANFATSQAVTDSTLFMLASVSKTFTGLALLQLWEAGRFDLDDDINDYMPIQIVNPHFPESPITFRMLLTHTSSLDDNWNVMYSTYVPGDTPIPLADYVAAYLLPGGEYYDADLNFHQYTPGAAWDYCNHGFVLIGYLVQVISGLPFAQYCQDSIFAPLSMDKTSWFLAGLDTNQVAMPYHYNGSAYVPYGHFGYADYPAGTLRSSAPQLARHLMVHLNHGLVDGIRVMDSATADAIPTPQCPTLNSGQGLTWYRSSIAGFQVWEHGGGDQGVSTRVGFCPANGTGVVVLTNGESQAGVSQIVDRLWRFVNTQGDWDGDGVADSIDNCLTVSNSNQADDDTDGVGNACDNCPATYNPDQTDDNNDGAGDVCDGHVHIASRILPDGYLGRSYSCRFAAFGGTPSYHWSLVGGDLPLGCVFNGDTIGTIIGIPTYKATYYFTLACHDAGGPADCDTAGLSITVTDPLYLCGDADGNDLVTISDAVYLINYIFTGGSAPAPPESGDVDCNVMVNISDAVYLINHVFSGGPAPCEGCK
jgi:CubicO group peptidase (beta-lactamase class C family)